MFLKTLLKPKDYPTYTPNAKFPCKKEHIIELANEVINILQVQPVVIKDLKPPLKVFGDLHGQYVDLMRFFDIYQVAAD